jgi:deoxyribodipyrimidine photo-lyase
MKDLGIFIFHRDFRVVDNIGLHSVAKLCKQIIPVFIFTPEQVSDSNKYKSDNAVQFMIEALDELYVATDKKLACFYGDNISVLKTLLHKYKPDIVAFNRDYTPYAIQRDTSIQNLCKDMSVECATFADYYLFEPGTLTKNGYNEDLDKDNLKDLVYKKFTPFYNKAKENKKHIAASVGAVNKFHKIEGTIEIKDAYQRFCQLNPNAAFVGGRTEALKLLRLDHSDYSKTHNYLFEETTGLSPYIKFGCISVREMYKRFYSVEPLIRQLFWREFYATLLYAFPTLGEPVDPKYNKIKWSYNKAHFNAWAQGRTGFPVVDACMRQLVQTGAMHNRGRLIVASFLCKTLLIDWRWGERFFAQHLTDYDVASNMHNWLWIAGGGADSQEYFRIFNPWAQSENYDKEGVFIKRWVPELADMDARDLHNPDKHETIVDYAEEKPKVLKAYKQIFT